MPVRKEKIIYRRFILSTGLVVAVAMAGIFYDMAVRTEQMLDEDNLIRARVAFDSILIARQWNAGYGGVYVEKKPGIESNPYLEHPDVRLADGRVFTLRNPALMTREMSRLSEQIGRFRFHITSLKPLNPQNSPDSFEAGALQRFAKEHIAETSATERQNNRTMFRYMAPLLVQEDCLDCHRKENYKTGEVRGGISVTFDIEDQESRIRMNIASIIFIGVVTVILLLGMIYFFMNRLIRRLEDARREIEKRATTDDLTGLYNRRNLLSRFTEEFEKSRRLNETLSCMIVDIDHFKAVNDRLGHLAGDEVLKGMAAKFRNLVRAYDIVGRLGGEEFLIVLPGSNLEQAWNFGERIRMAVKENEIAGVPITISLGVTTLLDSDESIGNLIKRADDALYVAKDSGRDRVEWLPK